MGQLNLPNNFTSLLNTNEDWTKVQDNLDAITSWANGNIADDNLSGNAGITAANLATAVKQGVGLNDGGGTNYSGQAFISISESTASTSFADLATPGPSVTITVPAGGLVELFAQVEIWGNTDTGIVGLHEATDFSTPGQILAAAGAPVLKWTGAGLTDGTSSRVLGSRLTFAPTSGTRTYKLQYKSNTGGSCAFAFRFLAARAVLL